MTAFATTSMPSSRLARRYRRSAAFRRGLVRLRQLPRILRWLSRHLVGAAGALAARHHFRHPFDAQAACRAVAGIDDPCPARRNAAAGHGALQRSVHDAHLDVAAIRHHRLLRCRGRDDGAAGRPGARAGDDRRGAELPPRHDRGQEAARRLVVVRCLAAGSDGLETEQQPDRLDAEAGRQVARVRGARRRTTSWSIRSRSPF